MVTKGERQTFEKTAESPACRNAASKKETDRNSAIAAQPIVVELSVNTTSDSRIEIDDSRERHCLREAQREPSAIGPTEQ